MTTEPTPTFSHRRIRRAWLCGALSSLFGCQAGPPASQPLAEGAAGVAVAPSAPAIAAQPGAGMVAVAPRLNAAAAGTGVASTPTTGPIGSAGRGASGVAALASGGAGASAGAPAQPSTAGNTAHDHDHCASGEQPDARDMLLLDKPDQWKSSASGAVDLMLPKIVLDWMKERVWEGSHDAWHNIRRCKGGGFSVPGAPGSTICSHMDLIPAHQECADAEDGYEFLVVHRHMLQALKQAFPRQQDLFEGFVHFPYAATDVPEIWRDRWGTGWAANIKQTAGTLEDIENKLGMFPSEGDLGKLIQCGGMANGASSIHGALHFKWVVNDSPYSLGKQTVNIDNYMFWKLHGWIDRIWERYRVAKGLAPDEPKLVQALARQCMEMDSLGKLLDPSHGVDTTSPLPQERGVFHEQVRPIFEKHCASCHSESSPEAGLSLGGHLSSADIVKALVGVQAVHGGQLKRVVARSAAQSWLYLKASGTAMNAGCMGTMCNAQVMPPTGQVTLTSQELSTLQKWIDDGAAAPTP